MREQVEVLEHHADLAPDDVDAAQIIGQLGAVDDDLAGLVLFESVDAADHGRLAGARRPGHNDALALHHLEVDVAQHMKIAIPLVDVDQLDRGLGGRQGPRLRGSFDRNGDV